MAVVVFASTTDPPLPLKAPPPRCPPVHLLTTGVKQTSITMSRGRARRMGSARSHDVMSIPMPTISEGIAQSCRE